MYPYTKELTLNEALKLHQVAPDTVVATESIIPFELRDFEIKEHYNLGRVIFITALDYAIHILGQAAPPEGWGYAAYPLDSGRYDKFPCLICRFSLDNLPNDWIESYYENFGQKIKPTISQEWNHFAFRLEDLARVETEPKPLHLQSLNELADTAFKYKPITEKEKTEINAAQAEWLSINNPFINYSLNGINYSNNVLIRSDIRNAKDVDKYQILTSDYNSLPDEFKALADVKPINYLPCPKCAETHDKLMSEIEALNKQLAEFEALNKQLAEMKGAKAYLSIAPAKEVDHTDWKAKYEAQAAEITNYLEMGTENASLKLQMMDMEKEYEDLSSSLIVYKSKARVLINLLIEQIDIMNRVTKLKKEIDDSWI